MVATVDGSREAVKAPTDSDNTDGDRTGAGRTDDIDNASTTEWILARIASVLTEPGLVMLTGVPGAGLTTALGHAAARFRGPVFTGGGLAILRTTPGLALTRAVRLRLPVADPALLVEAVRSRVRDGLLILDDLQWGDPTTLAALPNIARHCRVLAAMRVPHPLPKDVERRLQTAARAWLPLPALDNQAAEAVVRRATPGLAPTVVAEVVRRAGGIPLALESLARHAAIRNGHSDVGRDSDPRVAYAVAQALADLTRPARTAMAALGLLGTSAPDTLLGPGVSELVTTGLVTRIGDDISPRSPYVAEVAAGMLEPTERRQLHRRLAELVPKAQAPRHLAAAGDTTKAFQRALAAATSARTTGERADLLLFACGLKGVSPSHDIVLATAEAALGAGRLRSCTHILGTATDPRAALLRAEALLQCGRPQEAQTAAATIPGDADDRLVAARDRIQLLAALTHGHTDPTALITAITARHGRSPQHTGLRAALAAAAAQTRGPNWETALATAAVAAGTAGDNLAARWSAWLLVEYLAADGRLHEAADAAGRAAAACAVDLAYSWQTRFLAAELWCTALRGDALDSVVRRALDLLDRTVPAVAHSYAVAAAALAEADSGLLAAARARLVDHDTGPPSVAGVLDWVKTETAWLDGQPDHVEACGFDDAADLIRGLRQITTRWTWHDGGSVPGDHSGEHPLTPVRATLAAWHAVTTDPDRAAEFGPAARSWHSVVRREEIRCLLALGSHARSAEQAVPPLLDAERLAEQAGFVVLLGRVRRALRRHSVRRDTRGARAGDDLTDRERDVLRLVAQGEPTRRIAGLLGISRETVETHVRSGMRKFGARTRTEAAARAMEVLG
jgi:DNA-binding CsgD family transcriptional regulator